VILLTFADVVQRVVSRFFVSLIDRAECPLKKNVPRGRSPDRQTYLVPFGQQRTQRPAPWRWPSRNLYLG